MTTSAIKHREVVVPVQYVTNEQGQRTGVLLDIAAYQRLIERQFTDTDLLTEMSRAELEALSASRLALASQSRLDELLAQQEEGMLGKMEPQNWMNCWCKWIS